MAEALNEIFANAVADQLDQQKAYDAEANKQQQAAQVEINSAREALLRKLTERNQTQVFPKEVQDIAAVLVSQPRLIQPTQQFLQHLVTRINEAVDREISEMLGKAANGNSSSTAPPAG